MAEIKPVIKPHDVILFQGDSITDADRSRSAIGPNSQDGMGFGYPRLAMESSLEKYPNHQLQFYNRGISGNRIQDLRSRWQVDTLDLLPDILSILIGVNDTWNYLMLGLGASPGDFQDIYRNLLQDSQKAQPYTRFVLCEPFLLITGEVTSEWLGDLSERQQRIVALAEEFNAVFVPFQTALDQAVKDVPAHHLLDDGVHPTAMGHQVLADCWINAVLG